MRCIIEDIILVKLKKDIKIGVKINYDILSSIFYI
jgi:hypothetical protein